MGEEEDYCFMKKNSTLSFLVIFAVGMLIGIFANIYFIFNPSNYKPSYDLKSLWDYWILLLPLFVLYLTIKEGNLNAKIFWFILFVINLFDILRRYIFIYPSGYAHEVTAFVCSLIFILTIIFISRYRKDKFDLFDIGKTDKA